MLKRTVLSLAVLSALAFQVQAQESSAEQSPPSLPGSVFVLPEEGGTPVEADNDMEITSDFDFFIARGFAGVDWETHTAQVGEVLKNVALPDWKRRTGSKEDPVLPSIDVAAENILGGDYNDLLVMSRLPGDCGPEGCLFQLYSLVNDVWVKRFEFKTIGFAWKQSEDGNPVIAQVGGMWIPSKTYTWSDGQLR
jgi:hypothetical protein